MIILFISSYLNPCHGPFVCPILEDVRFNYCTDSIILYCIKFVHQKTKNSVFKNASSSICGGDIWCIKLARLISPLCALRLLGQRDYMGRARATNRAMRLQYSRSPCLTPYYLIAPSVRFFVVQNVPFYRGCNFYETITSQ